MIVTIVIPDANETTYRAAHRALMDACVGPFEMHRQEVSPVVPADDVRPRGPWWLDMLFLAASILGLAMLAALVLVGVPR